MSFSAVWITILCASVISFGLRALPFLVQAPVTRLNPRAADFVQLCGYAIIGSMMSEVVFSPLFSSPLPLIDVALRLGCTALGMTLMLCTKRSILSFALGYLVFVLLYSQLVLRGALYA